MQYLLVALRNLSRQRRRSFMLGGAIAFGILVVTLINGFAGSFVENVSENFSQLLAGHIFVEGVEKVDARQVRVIRDDEILTSTLDELDIPVRFISRRSEFDGQIVFQGNTIRQNIIGADWTQEEFLKERLVLLEGGFEGLESRPGIEGSADRAPTPGSDTGAPAADTAPGSGRVAPAADTAPDPDSPAAVGSNLTAVPDHPRGIILSKPVADRLRAQVGDLMSIRLRTVNGQQNIGDFRLEAISHDPGLFGSLSAYADLGYVNQLLGLAPGEYQTLGIFVDSIPAIDRRFEPYYAALEKQVQVFPRNQEEDGQNPVEALFDAAEEEDWEGVRYRLYTLNDVLVQVEQIVDLLNDVSLVILLVLFFIIMVGITNTFRMIMIERVKEIGTVRALGMQRRAVLGLFLLEAGLLSLGGSLAGLALAGLTMAILSGINLGLDSVIFILLKNGYLTFALSLPQIVLNFSIVILLTLVAAFVPSRRASRMSPVDALRA